jgi:hypothetical protein
MNTTDIVMKAKAAASRAAADKLAAIGGVDRGACGFAWVEVYVDGRSRKAKELKAAGFGSGWLPRQLTLWSPAQAPVQNIDVHEAGAQAAAKVLKDNGIEAFARSRLD